jgi:type I restriction enzyme S subunit
MAKTSWPVKNLGDICEIYQPQTIGLKDMVPDGPYVVYGANGPIGRYDRFNHEKSEVTVTCRGATCGTVNVTPPQVWITGNAMVVRPNEAEMSKLLLKYWLEGLDYSSVITGTAQPQITRTTLSPMKISVPPLAEQKRIVALLDAATAHITELTACYEQARTHANNLFTSALRDALESNPDWPLKTLGDFCDIYQPQTIGMKDLVADGKYIVYGANGPIGRYDRFNHEKSEVTVTCRGATCGTVNVTPPEVWITGNAMVVRPNEMEMSKEMICYVLEGLDYSRIITGAAQPQITRQTLAPSTIQVPPLDEQKKIVERMDSMRARTSEMVAAYDAKLIAARNLRQSILEAAFAGDL